VSLETAAAVDAEDVLSDGSLQASAAAGNREDIAINRT